VTNRSKSKGTAWETAIVGTCHDAGFEDARRVVLAGTNDQGDVHVGDVAAPLVAIEAKNENRVSLAEYVTEANREGVNAGAIYGGVAWVHRKGKADPLDGYVVMDGRTFLGMLGTLAEVAR
jgi:hypothetical protein